MLLQFGDRFRRANAGDDIFALGVNQKFAVEYILAVGRIAGERHAGTGVVAGVTEHHRLHVHGRSPFLGNVVFAAINNRAIVHPRTEHGADRAVELFPRIVREILCRCVLSRAF